MQPLVQHVQGALERLDARFREVVRSMPGRGLNWRPGDEATNSVAMIIRHVAFGENLLLDLASGGPLPGALDPRTRGLHNDPATRAELLGLLDRATEGRRERLERLATLDLGEAVPGIRGEPRARAVYLIHCVAEAAEHLGHAELTRQLWEREVGAELPHPA